MDNYQGKKIWIIGASSGIGKALARKLAHRGATLALSARSENELKEIARVAEGDHHVIPLDVSDQKAFKKAAKEAHKSLGQIDSVIFMAAIYNPGLIKDIDLDNAELMLKVNLLSAMQLTELMLPIYKEQGHGQLAFTASVAGYRGLPKGQPYSATKAALINYVESLKAEETEIDIRLISPGFVKTPMTDMNDFEMPFAIEAEQAARHIADGLLSKSYEIHFPKIFTYMTKFIQIIPNFLYFILARKMVEKMEKDESKKEAETSEKTSSKAENDNKAA
ncbi:MAG: SDR family NAD(P)-dependent oxidoreductase [Pseudomonadota bacterium]